MIQNPANARTLRTSDRCAACPRSRSRRCGGRSGASARRPRRGRWRRRRAASTARRRRRDRRARSRAACDLRAAAADTRRRLSRTAAGAQPRRRRGTSITAARPTCIATRVRRCAPGVGRFGVRGDADGERGVRSVPPSSTRKRAGQGAPPAAPPTPSHTLEPASRPEQRERRRHAERIARAARRCGRPPDSRRRRAGRPTTAKWRGRKPGIGAPGPPPAAPASTRPHDERRDRAAHARVTSASPGSRPGREPPPGGAVTTRGA